MYLPKSKYSKPIYTRGDELTVMSTGKPYVGWYFEIYNGKVYKGKDPDSAGAELKKISSGVEKPSLRFTPDAITPPELTDSVTTFKRYFLQDKRNKQIIEVNINKFNFFSAKSYIIGVVIKWNMKGPAADSVEKGYRFIGTASKNKETVSAFALNIPELPKFIEDYSEFVV